MIDADFILLVLMFICIGIMAITAITDRVLFYYKKTPGRGYAQLAKPGKPQWLISLYSNLELIGFLGFIACVATLAWRLS